MGAEFSQLMTDSVNADLPRFLLELVLVLVWVRVLGRILSYIRQPYVIGEIIAGVLLGPSAFGQIPHFSEFLFPENSLIFLEIISEVALMFFMFFLGLEIQSEGIVATWKQSVPTAALSIILPFCLGITSSFWLYYISESQVHFAGFALFLGLCLSFTAFPVLARILAATREGRALNSPLGDHVLAIAAVDDVLAWTCMALIIAYATGASQLVGLYIALLTIGFICFQFFVIKPLLAYVHNKLVEQGRELEHDFVIFLLLGMFLSSWVTQCIGIHAFFGAFCFGLMVPKTGTIHTHILPQLELLIIDIFVPLYFARSGLNTDLTLLTGETFAIAIFLTVIASFGKMLPALIHYRVVGHSWAFAAAIGVLINTRGMVSIIAANIGLNSKVIDTQMFTLLVIMNILTTMITPPLFYFIYEHWLETDDKDPDLQRLPNPAEQTEEIDEEACNSPIQDEDFYTSPQDQNRNQSNGNQSNSNSSSTDKAHAKDIEDGIPLTELPNLREPLSPQKMKSDTPPRQHVDEQLNRHLENMSQRELNRLTRIASAIEKGQRRSATQGSLGTGGGTHSGSIYHSRTIGSVNLKW